MALSTISGTTGITDATITSAKLADFSAAVDLNGVELILDADQDTSITADTDDRIDFKIAGVEHISISNSSGDTIIKPMVDAKDIVFQQYDGNKILEINDGNYVAISGAAAGPGELRFYEDTDLGTNYTGFKAGNATASVSYVLPLADASSSGYALTSNASGVLSWAAMSANTPTSADGQALGSASLEWSDLFLADGGTIQLGNDQDVTLTHVADTGVLLNSTRKIQFNDASQFIHGSSATVLSIGATDEIDLTATAIDINGTCDVSGTFSIGGTAIGSIYGVIAGSSSIVTTGALDTGSITSGFTSIDVGAGAITTTGVITGGTLEATTDTAANDNAAIGYTAGEGLILTGQGSTSDITLKNDADATVFTVPTGTDDILFPDSAKAMWGAGSDLEIYHNGTNSFIYDDANDLTIEANQGDIYLRVVGESGIDIIGDGATNIYYNGAKVIETILYGVATRDGAATTPNYTFIADTNTGMYNAGSDILMFSTAGVKRLEINAVGKASHSKGVTPAQIDAGLSFELLYTGSSDAGIGIATTANANASGFISFNRSTTTQIGHINRNGTSDAVNYNTSSDYRLKENIASIDDGITRVKLLTPRRFSWKNDSESTMQDGFIAHELDSIVTHAVSGTKDAVRTLNKVVVNNEDDIVSFDIEQADWTAGKATGQYPSDSTWAASKLQIIPQAMDYGTLTPLLAAALKEAIAKIETLETKVQALEDA